MDKNKIIVFDTTLRDGEQSPGCSMNTEEKIKVAFISILYKNLCR